MDQKIIDALKESIEDLEIKTANFKGMFYGESGVGKTIMALQIAQATTPAGKSIVYFDSTEGWVSALNHPGLTDRVIRLAYKGLPQIAAFIQAHNEGIEPFSNTGCIILDEASTIARSDLDVVVKARSKLHSDKDPDVPVLPDMNSSTQRMRMAMLNILQQDFNVILCAHIREDKDERTGKTYTRPDFMPKLSKSIREMLHLVGHVTSKEYVDDNEEIAYQRLVQVNPTESIVAKTRIGGLPVRCEIEELIGATVEWLKGARPTVEVNKILPDLDTLIKEELEPDENVGISVD